MEFPGRFQPWTIAENEPGALVHALYARDASGLRVETGAPISALDPVVAVDGRLASYATPQAAAEWPQWWQSELDLNLVPAPDQPDLWFAGRSVGPDLRALLTETTAAVDRWQQARPQEHVRLFPRRAPSRQLLVTHLVAEVEGGLGRRAATFHLRISVLPVQGVWGVRARADRVLVSRELHEDQAALREFLAPVIAGLA